MNSGTHRWRFFRAGGFEQARIDSGAELFAIDSLDLKLWVALSCPTRGIEFDARTLALVDSDGDGHVRANELIAAVKWAGSRLKDLEALAQGHAGVPLDQIRDDDAEGAALLAAARVMLLAIDKTDATLLTVEDAERARADFAKLPANGDGIVPPSACGDETVAAAVNEIAALFAGPADRTGEAGVDAKTLEKFSADANALTAWRAAGAEKSVRLAADATERAHAAVDAVRAKIEDYFIRCRLAGFDQRAATAMTPANDALAALGAQTLSAESEGLASLPLAAAASGRPLPLAEGLNPAWSERVDALREHALAPLLGNAQSLSEADWHALLAALVPYDAWLAAKPATPLAAVDAERLAALAAADTQARLAALIADDEARRPDAEAMDAVEKLARYCRDLHALANNFVAFRDFYTRRAKATFQIGTLYLDGRSCDLCVAVNDPARHAALATLSRLCLVYCDCVRGSEKMAIAAAFTAGDSDQLMVRRNGVFYDRKGRDWDATITRIVDHPISLRQAFWSPYKRLARLIAEQVQKFAGSRAKAVDNRMAAATAEAAKKAEAPAAKAQAQAFDIGKFAGIFAAIGLAVGVLGTALASMVTGMLGLRWWQMPLVLVALLLVISGPAVAIAWFKLHSRNLGPILDANGWAVNARAKINIPFGTLLTQLAELPPGAERSLADPYAEKEPPWKVYALIAIIAIAALVWWLR